MIRNSSRVVLIAAVAMLAAARSQAQDELEESIVRIYRVVDLVLPAPNYPYLGTYLPGLHSGSLSSGSGAHGMSGGTGMSGGGMGGGMFQVPDRLAQVAGGGRGGIGGGLGGMSAPASSQSAGATMAIDMDRLIEAITAIVEPTTWDEVGGEGSIQPIGGALAIRQTPAVQFKIQEFLEALKRESGALRMITVDARWLALDTRQAAQLAEKPEANKPPTAGQTVDRKALAALPAEKQRYTGRITCFNGQTVHIISGRLETVVSGAIPVVGSGKSVGYQPVMQSPHLGVLLQITPSVLPAGDAVLVDLHSSITRWEESAKPAHIGTAPESDVSIEVDRINVTAQQFATSLRVPLDKPVLVGGITYPPDGSLTPDGQGAEKPDGGRAGLYLMIEVHATGE